MEIRHNTRRTSVHVALARRWFLARATRKRRAKSPATAGKTYDTGVRRSVSAGLASRWRDDEVVTSSSRIVNRALVNNKLWLRYARAGKKNGPLSEKTLTLKAGSRPLDTRSDAYTQTRRRRGRWAIVLLRRDRARARRTRVYGVLLLLLLLLRVVDAVVRPAADGHSRVGRGAITNGSPGTRLWRRFHRFGGYVSVGFRPKRRTFRELCGTASFNDSCS